MPANMDAAVIHIGENYDGNEPNERISVKCKIFKLLLDISDFDVPNWILLKTIQI